MTYEKLAEEIAKMTPEQRKRPAVIAMQVTGEVAEVKEILPIEDFNGVELPDQKVIWYDKYSEAKVF